MEEPIWTPKKIKIELLKRDTNLTQLAVDNDLSVSALRVALVKAYPKAEKVLADFLGVGVEELFPNRYQKHDEVA
ncbi:MAG: helix-turn-helix domain-containing protein [Alphaproteobacteria bacterium]